MKKQFLTLIAATLASTTMAQANQSTRVQQVAVAFLKQANSSNTDVAKKLSAVREDLSTGFCYDACVIPQKLKSSDIRMVVTSSETYVGKVEDEHSQPTGGYENLTLDVHVPAKSISYGGRISTMETVVFQCTLEAGYQVSKANIACSEKKN